MADVNIKLGQLNTSNATDGDLLVYVGANDVVEYRDVVSDIDSRVLANVNAVQDNVDTFASYANSTFVSSVSGTANEIDVSGSTSVTLSLPDNLIAPGDLTITGNLTVSGNTTYVNTETLEVEDNIITLNSSLGSGVTPTENAGLEVNRGAQANVQFRWNETLETWEYGEVDTSDFTRVDESQSTVVLTRNESGSAIAAGTPVYITGYSAGGSRPTIAPADADLAGAMPALGITLESASTNSNQRVVAYGTITGLNTSSFVPGDELYVSATAGTLQNTRPTGSSTEIQKIAKVLRSDTSAGSIIVMGAGRTNAIPNLPTDHVFIGDGGATHTTINLNAEIQTQSAANDYSTYTTLVSLIDTVQDNVTAIPDSAANDYATYTTLISSINTVSDNVQSGDQTAAANDHATYTTLISSINTVQDNVAQNVHQITTTGNTTTNSIEVAGLKTDSLQIGNTDLTATASELNILDGDTTATSTTVATGDRVVLNDSGTMVQVDVDDIDTYFSGTTQTLTNKTLRGPTFESGNNAPEFLETRYVNATQMDFVQLYTGGSNGSYFTQGEYQKIATIIPDGGNQNYTFIIRMTATSASNYQIVTFTGALRSNTLPDLTFTVNYNEEHNGVRFIEPKLWTKETTTAGFILAFEYVYNQNLYGGVNVEAIIIPRSDAQRENVTFNTTQNSEQTTIDTGYTENDPNLVYSQVSGTLEFGTQFRIEGSTADGNELTITASDPTADRTATFPDATGHVALFAADPGSTTISSTPTELNLLSGVTGLVTATDFQANDHATYTAVSALIDTVQANLTSDVAVLDSFGSYANSTFALSNEAVTFTDLEVDNLTVDGDLVVRGNTTTLEATNTLFTDPLMLLNNGVTGANTADTGIIFNRGTLANAAMMYDESEDVFHFGFTQQGGDATDLTYTALAPIRAGVIRGGNVEVGASSDGNHITAINGKTLKISGDESQATNIEIASNVIPTQNAVFSIGSPTAQLKDIHVSDGTIFIGTNSQISAESVSLTNFNVDSDGTIRIPGVNITADANAVETVQIVASDIASNAVIQAQINATVGFLTELNTTTQANVVDAINELIVDIGTVSDNAAAQTDATSDQFTISTQNTFTMSSSVSEANNIVVSVSGLLQMPSDDYVVSGTTLTLNNTTPLPQGASVEVRHIPTTGGGPAPTPSSILIDGNSASDTTYDGAVWTAGSDSAGIGFNEGVGLTWNSTNGRVTVASAGLYEIKWTPYLTGSGGENGHPQRWRLFKNGSQHVAAFTNVYIDAAGGTDQSTTSIVLNLEADDYIQVKGSSGTGFRPRIYGGSGHTYLQVTRVS